MSDHRTNERASGIERAKALKAIRAVVSDEQFARISQELVSDDEAAAMAAKIAGLTEEDEFAVLCRLMKTTSHVVPLEQSPIIPGDSIIPDFLVRFQPGLWLENKTRKEHHGFLCFVEVKSTPKLEWRISGSLLLRRRNFAAAFGLPLLFAVRFTKFPGNAYWVVVHDEDWAKKSVVVSVGGLTSSLRHILFDEYWYLIRPGTTFEQVFSTRASSGGVWHSRYGTLLEFRVVAADISLAFKGAEAAIWSAFFEAYRLEEVCRSEDGDQTVVRLKPGVDSCSIIDLVYCFNCLPSDATGKRTFDPARSIARADSDPSALLIADRDRIEAGALRMQKLGILLLLGVGEPDEHSRLWRKYGGA